MSAAATPPNGFPTVAPEFVGVAIALSPPSATVGPIDLLGAFQFPEAIANDLDPHPHRAIVLVVASREGNMVSSPYRETIFFGDDVARAGGVVRGLFVLRLVKSGVTPPNEQSWATVSIGTYLSNTVAFGAPGL